MDFETRSFATSGGIQPQEIAVLNADQATYLITLFPVGITRFEKAAESTKNSQEQAYLR